MSGLLSNAISGLQASQNALRTAGHNISNANTAGFSRQEVGYVTRPEQRQGMSGYIGSGVTTQSIERVVNEFVTAQLRLDTSSFNQLDKFNSNIGKIDKLFAEMSTGLAGGLQRFFAAIQNGADDPSSTPARQLILTEADSLATRFNTLHDRLLTIEKSVNREVSTVTAQMTSLANSVAELNRAIENKMSAASGAPPNDLLDKRDEALRELSELVGIQVVPDGLKVNVFIGSGQPLVVGSLVSKFNVSGDGQIRLTNGIHTANVTEQISGGQLGGLLSFRKDVLQPSMNELGRIAIVLADTFNELQRQGLDLDGDYGQLLFNDINDSALLAERIKHGNNAAPNDRELSLRIDDVSQLTISDYRLQILPNTSNYVVTRLQDNQIVNQGILSGAYPYTIEFDGVQLELTSGSFQGGDSFILQPTFNGARDISAELTRPEDLAFAAPIRTGKDIGNVGTGVISPGEVLSLVDVDGNLLPAFANAGELSPPIIIRFTSATTYEVLDNSNPGNPVPLNPPMREQTFTPGVENAIFPIDPGETRIIGDGARMGLPEGRSPVILPVGAPAQVNTYPVEQLTFLRTDPETGLVIPQVLVTTSNASAAQTAAQLSNVSGVSANAFTTATLTDINIEEFDSPLQITLNGESLIEYGVGLSLHASVPNPQDDEAAFNDYLAARINDNPNLAALGVRAVSGNNAITGRPELRMIASSGVNLDIRLEADNATTNYIGVNDSNGNPTVRLEGAGAGNQSSITVGGRIDLTLADGVSLRTAPTTSQFFGDSTAEDFALPSYLGYQVTVKGQPQAGDSFSIDFNRDATNDNRNALRLAGLETEGRVSGGSLSFSEAYARLVETVGTKSSLSAANTEASKSILLQTQTMRDSISGVNLDEEAANLIRFEQMYNANARVISVARDLFDTLLNAL